MKITKAVFVGSLVPTNMEKEVFQYSKQTMYEAANSLQWKMIHGIDKAIANKIELINYLPIGSYPRRYKKLIIKKSSFDERGVNIGFFNLPLLKFTFISCALKREVAKMANSNVFIGYSLDKNVLKSLLFAKKKFPRAKTLIIVPDVHEYIDLTKNLSFLRKIYSFAISRYINKNIKKIDSFVFLTKQMADYYKISENYTVIEGISNCEQRICSTECYHDARERIILYSGSTHEAFGVLDLVEAFKLISSDDLVLVICGSGDSDSKIIEEQGNDARIRFLGKISHEETLKIQQEAFMLVNPRKNIGDFTKYSFPSKNLEYLDTGNPVVAYKLDGIPSEYDDFLNYPKNNSIEALKEKIIEICSMSDQDRRALYEKTKAFLFSQKTSEIQGKKIIKLIESLRSEK